LRKSLGPGVGTSGTLGPFLVLDLFRPLCHPQQSVIAVILSSVMLGSTLASSPDANLKCTSSGNKGEMSLKPGLGDDNSSWIVHHLQSSSRALRSAVVQCIYSPDPAAVRSSLSLV